MTERRTPRAWGRAALVVCLAVGATLSWAHANNEPRASRVALTLLASTDLHGHIFPENDETGRPANLGLAKIATLVERERVAHANTLLLDCGDTTEGTALAYLAATKYAEQPNPMIAAMNALGYDAMAVGNHDFNFGLGHVEKIRREAEFPILAANVETLPGAAVKPFPPFAVKTVAGIRVGIMGVVTPGIARGENPDNYRGYRFLPIVETVARVAAELRPKVDLLVLVAHSGLGREPPATEGASGEENPENAMLEVANRVPDIDVIFYGHTHQEMGELFVHGALLAQAKFWGQSLAEAEIEMVRGETGGWHVASKHSRVIPVTSDVEADLRVLQPARAMGRATTEFLDRPVAHLMAPLDGATGRVEDTALVDWIHRAQMDAVDADVSLATMFRPGVRFAAGSVTVRELYALYPYDNELYAIEMSGAELKEALEHAASFYPGWPRPNEERALPLPSYEADSAAGVSYVIDLTQPVGGRIRELEYRGKPLGAGQRLIVALNHYRYYGDERFRSRTIVRRAAVPVFELLVKYAERTKEMPVRAVGIWRIEPREAREALERAAEQR